VDDRIGVGRWVKNVGPSAHNEKTGTNVECLLEDRGILIVIFKISIELNVEISHMEAYPVVLLRDLNILRNCK